MSSSQLILAKIEHLKNELRCHNPYNQKLSSSKLYSSIECPLSIEVVSQQPQKLKFYRNKQNPEDEIKKGTLITWLAFPSSVPCQEEV